MSHRSFTPLAHLMLIAPMAVATLASCLFAPELGEGDLRCGTGVACPPGYGCRADGRCYPGAAQSDLVDGGGTRDRTSTDRLDSGVGDRGSTSDRTSPDLVDARAPDQSAMPDRSAADHSDADASDLVTPPDGGPAELREAGADDQHTEAGDAAGVTSPDVGPRDGDLYEAGTTSDANGEYAVIQTSPLSYTLLFPPSSSSTLSRRLLLSSNSLSVVDFTVTCDAPWLSCWPTTGDVSMGMLVEIALAIDPSSMTDEATSVGGVEISLPARAEVLWVPVTASVGIMQYPAPVAEVVVEPSLPCAVTSQAPELLVPVWGGDYASVRVARTSAGIDVCALVPDTSLFAQGQGPSLSLDDSIELLIDLDHDRGEAMALGDHRFVVNADGTTSNTEADGLGLDLTWSATAGVYGTLNDGYDDDVSFQIEASIPFSEAFTGVPDPGDLWGIEVIINDRDSEVLDDTVHYPWSANNDQSRYSPASWAELIFTDGSDNISPDPPFQPE